MIPESEKERDKLRDAVATIIDPKPFEVFDAEWRRTNGRGVTYDQLNVIGKMTIAREKSDAILALLASRLTLQDDETRKAALEEVALGFEEEWPFAMTRHEQRLARAAIRFALSQKGDETDG